MKNTIVVCGFVLLNCLLSCQSYKRLIKTTQVERIESTLASDDMQGRKAFTPGIEKAADFIAAEFKTIGLKPMEGLQDYRQTFTMISPNQVNLSATIDGQAFPAQKVLVVTPSASVDVNEASGYEINKISAGENLGNRLQAVQGSKKDQIVLVDTSFSKYFGRLNFLKRYLQKDSKNIILLLTPETPKAFRIQATHEIKELTTSNIAGVLPGRTKADEFVIFSGHYDHLGIGKPTNGDSIYNGANDDASGVTAVISLAKYYARKKQNERTLLFVAFTAEELGGYGSKYFSKQMDADKVAAMFNIEMIGTESKWGKNSAYISGFEKTNMGSILQQNLAGTDFTFYPDPYPDQQLFYRSDNATLARLGVPAHTISTSKMDDERNYHKVSDEISTLDLANMTEIIRAIVLSAKSIVEGKDAPTRVIGE